MCRSKCSKNRDSEGHDKRHSCTARPWRCPHHRHNTVPVSEGAPYPGHHSVPHNHGPHLYRLNARKGSHDVQCASGSSCSGLDLMIHLRAGDGITCLFKRIFAGDVLPSPPHRRVSLVKYMLDLSWNSQGAPCYTPKCKPRDSVLKTWHKHSPDKPSHRSPSSWHSTTNTFASKQISSIRTTRHGGT